MCLCLGDTKNCCSRVFMCDFVWAIKALVTMFTSCHGNQNGHLYNRMDAFYGFAATSRPYRLGGGGKSADPLSLWP